MTIKTFNLMAIAILTLCVYRVNAALAQGPALQVGDDFRPKSLACCLADARFAMDRNKAGKLSMTQSGNIVFGQGPNVSVVVICEQVNGGVRIPVVAASSDSATAERYRNEVRIVAYNAVHFDTCP